MRLLFVVVVVDERVVDNVEMLSAHVIVPMEDEWKVFVSRPLVGW